MAEKISQKPSPNATLESPSCSSKELNQTVGLVYGYIKGNEDKVNEGDSKQILQHSISFQNQERDEKATEIGLELARIADNLLPEEGSGNLETLVTDLWGSPTLAFKLFSQSVRRLIDWNEKGIQFTALNVKVILSMCYRLINKFVNHFCNVRDGMKQAKAFVTQVIGYLAQFFQEYGFFSFIRDNGWQALAPLSENAPVAVGTVAIVGAVVLAGVGVIYYMYNRLQS